MRRSITPALKTKCHSCPVARKRGGCLFGCTRKEKLARELRVLIEEGTSGNHPLTEQLRKCPQAFETGRLLEELFRASENISENRILPPQAQATSPFV